MRIILYKQTELLPSQLPHVSVMFLLVQTQHSREDIIKVVGPSACSCFHVYDFFKKVF